ncbi:hypothetical protein WL22_23750 [Burkholderia ubonensis]|nr:hypothetical protein WL22_23750 [Burkholderia ubonensis]
MRVIIWGETIPILIREQGRKIKVIRRVKAADTGRFRQRVIGAFMASDPAPAALIELLDKSERRTLEAWLGAYRNAAEVERARVTLAGTSTQLASIVDALAIAADTLAPTEADRCGNSSTRSHGHFDVRVIVGPGGRARLGFQCPVREIWSRNWR